MALLYPSVTGDDVCDLALDPDNENQYIAWGIGGLGETAFRHFTRAQSKANTDICTAMTLYCIPLICMCVQEVILHYIWGELAPVTVCLSSARPASPTRTSDSLLPLAQPLQLASDPPEMCGAT